MTRPKTDLTEAEFWPLLVRRVADVLRGGLTIRQLSDWMYAVLVNDAPVPVRRRQTILGGVKLIMFAKRKENHG